MNKTLPLCYIEVKEVGKRKFEHIATMVSDISHVMNFVNECKSNALKMYGKNFVYQITLIYDDNRKEVVRL